MKIKYPISHAYSLSVEEIFKTMRTNPSEGISKVEATIRQAQFGANTH
ncbi:cation-transporting P-type ATPase [Pedobacter sp. SL55]